MRLFAGNFVSAATKGIRPLLAFLFLLFMFFLAGYSNAATGENSGSDRQEKKSGWDAGTFECGLLKKSVTNIESMKMALELKSKNKQIKFLLDKQQDEQKQTLTALNIEADFQGNLIFNEKMFGFGSVGYLRDLSWYDDFIRIGFGLGYTGIANLKIQSGVHCASVYREKSYDRKTLFKTTIDFTIPLGGIFSFLQVADFELNLGEIHGIDSMPDDYSISLVPAVTADITETIFFAARYRWRYINNPITASGSQREYGLTIGSRL